MSTVDLFCRNGVWGWHANGLTGECGGMRGMVGAILWMQQAFPVNRIAVQCGERPPLILNTTLTVQGMRPWFTPGHVIARREGSRWPEWVELPADAEKIQAVPQTLINGLDVWTRR